MTRGTSDHGLEFLLGFDGRIHHLERATGSSSKSPALRRRRTGRMACPTRSRYTRRTVPDSSRFAERALQLLQELFGFIESADNVGVSLQVRQRGPWISLADVRQRLHIPH